MSFVARLVAQRRLAFAAVLVLSVAGVGAWRGMVRQEDPRLPDYWGQVTVALPGADAETVEELLLDPIEEQLARVDDLGEIRGTALRDLAILELELHPSVADADAAWDDVREALERVRPTLPERASPPRLRDDLQDQESVVLALVGDPDPLRLADAAERLRDRLLQLPLVARVELVAEPEDQVTVGIDGETARRLGLSPAALATQLATRTSIRSGGAIRVGDRSVTLRPQSEIEHLDELRSTGILLPDGSSVPLGAIARVQRGARDPAQARMRTNGELAVGLGVVPRRRVNLVEFGRSVRRAVAETAPALEPIAVEEVAFQPDHVESRLADLASSLRLGIAIVAGVLFVGMGLRLGLVVASIIPLVVLSTLSVYAMGGGVLHQISIAAVVIALGMLVDNAIVVAESIQWHLDRGLPPARAARRSIRELAAPLAAATATTLAVFVPMLLSSGPTAEFTRAIPVVVMIALTTSYLFAVLVTPALGALALRPRTAGDRPTDRLAALGARLGGLASRRPWAVLGLATLAVAASLLAAGMVRQEFFPEADRTQVVVELELAEGTPIEVTEERAARLEAVLLDRPEVARVTTLVGRSLPHFYYNLNQIPWTPHLAQMAVETHRLEEVPGLVADLRRLAAEVVPEATVVARPLEQGPPVLAPVEVRLYGTELPALDRGAQLLVEAIAGVDGAEDVRHTLGPGAPLLRFTIDDAAAARRGVTRADVAAALAGRTRGTPVGFLYPGDDPVPVVVRSPEGEALPLGDLEAIDVAPPGTPSVPLGQIARSALEWRPAAIEHRNHRRVVSVLAQLAPGRSYSEVLDALRPKLAALELPAGVEWEIGGAAEGSGEANGAMVRTLPIGLLLLVVILLAEFDSFRRLAIVLVTVPLAAAGVVPGLLLGDQPFGFMSLLGIIALVGVVVNNAIVLLDVIEDRRRDGASVAAAVSDAISRRIRPILLASVTTIAGLLPLALSPTSLWPPLAWALVSGLAASTLLTLLVVPALYLVLFRERAGTRRTRVVPSMVRAAGLVLVLLALRGSGPVSASQPERITLAEARTRAATSPSALAADRRADAAAHEALASRRLARLPSVDLEAAIEDQDRDLTLDTPVGELALGTSRRERTTVAVTQPLLVPARLFWAAPAAGQRAEAARFGARREAQTAASRAAHAYLDALAIDARLAPLDRLVASLEARRAEARARVEGGSALPTDAQKIELELDAARQARTELAIAREVTGWILGRAVGADGPLTPANEPLDPLPGLAPPAGPAVERALAARTDLAALGAAGRATELARGAVRAEAIPTLEAVAAWQWDSSTPFRDEAWVEGGIRLRWHPFAAASRAPRAAALAAQEAALAATRQELERAVAVEVRAALGAIESATTGVEVARRGIRLADETLRVERARFAAGRLSANDLLDAEVALARQEASLGLAEIELRRAWVDFELAVGDGEN